MTRTKLAAAVGMAFILLLACATIGIGGDQQANNQDTQQQELASNGGQQDQNTQNSRENAADTTEQGDSGNEDSSAGGKPPSTDIGGNAALWETDFGRLLESGDLAVEGIQANSDYETFGPILTIQFTNPSTDEILVSLPCGLVFLPKDSEIQALMMVQPLEINLAAGETAEYTPFVVCIEAAAGAPTTNAGYTIGYLESGDLLALAECVCGEEISLDIDSLDAVGVQFAAWSVATGDDLFGLAQGDDSSFQDFMDEMESSGMGEMFAEMLSAMGGEWLERCGITLEK